MPYENSYGFDVDHHNSHLLDSYKPSSPVEKLIYDVYSSDERYITELILLQSYITPSSALYSVISSIIDLHGSKIYLSTPENRKSWAIQADIFYAKYIKLYKYNPNEAPQLVYLFKRPLARIRLMSKTFKVRCLTLFLLLLRSPLT